MKRSLLIMGSLIFSVTVGACTSTDSSPAASGSLSVDILLEEAVTAHVNAELESAEALYKSVLELDPTNVFALFNLGLLAQQRGDLADAANRYSAALEADAAYVPALFNLAIIHSARGDIAAAEATYRRTLEIDDGYAAAHLNLGIILYQTGRTDEGLDHINRAYRLEPELVMADQSDPGS